VEGPNSDDWTEVESPLLLNWKEGGGYDLFCCPTPKSSIEVTICTSSNILVWFGRDASEKGVAGLRESLISSLFAIAKGLEKYRD
jgi:hypothetical protein